MNKNNKIENLVRYYMGNISSINSYTGILAKAHEQKIEDLTEGEYERIFKNCSSPIACKRAMRNLASKGITVPQIYNAFWNE